MSAITFPSPITFQAQWNQENGTLKPSDHVCARVWRVVKKILTTAFCCCAKPFVNLLVLPASKQLEQFQVWEEKWFGSVTEENKLLRKNFEAIPLNPKTPTGETVSGAIYLNKGAKGQDIPTIFYCGGNGELFTDGSIEWLLKAQENTSTPFNVVVFDYPSCGRSKGKITERNLLLAADAMYQCVGEKFHISEKNRHTIGMSLGGGVGAKLMAMHPNSGRFVNSHSFRSLPAMVEDTNLSSQLISILPRLITCCLWPSCVKKIGTSLLKTFDWKLDSESALAKIKDRTQIVHHPKDLAMQKAGLVYATKYIPKEILTLKATNKDIELGSDHHNTDYSVYVDQNGIPALERIVNFILGKETFNLRQSV
jgi:hypothetical protein